MQIVFSRRAENDLEEIGDYIAQDNPRRALSFVRELRVHCQRIANAPLSHPARPELGAGIRSVSYGNYVIYYRVIARSILIARVLHGARDVARQFSKE